MLVDETYACYFEGGKNYLQSISSEGEKFVDICSDVLYIVK